MGALSDFESAGSQEGGKLVGENLAGGTDPEGIVGGFGKNDGTKSLADVDNGKSLCESDPFGGFCAPPLDSSAFQVLGQDLKKEKDIVDSNKEKSSEGLKVGFSEQRTWSSLFGKKPNGKSFFLSVTAKSCWEKGEVQVFILDPLVDFFVSSMDFTLVGKFLGARPNLDSLRKMVKQK